LPSTKVEGRTRLRRARKKHRRAEELWDPEENKWKKYIRCAVCGRAWVCNNYPDKKPRLSPGERIGKKKVCVWCRSRNGKQIVQWMLIVEAVAKQPCETGKPHCKCLPCVARRIGTEVPKRGHA
jgi:hypothetical protein